MAVRIQIPGEGPGPRPRARGLPPALPAVPVQGCRRAPRGLQPALGPLLSLVEARGPPQRADLGAAGPGAVPDHLTLGGPGLGAGAPPRERRGGSGPGGGLAPRGPCCRTAGEARGLFSREWVGKAAGP